MAGNNIEVDPDARERLREQVEECDAVIREEASSADPVARRRVNEALRTKAVALGKLGRYESRVSVWELLIARHAEEREGADPLFVDRMLLNKAIDLRSSGRDQEAIDALADIRRRGRGSLDDRRSRLVSVQALAVTRDALSNLRRYEDASVLDAEIIQHFGDAAEPEVRRRVAYAFSHRAYVHLREGRIEDALRDSDELLVRFEGERDQDVLRIVGEIMLRHVQTLERVAGGRLGPLAGTLALGLAGALYEGGRYLGQRLRIPAALTPGNLGFGRVLTSVPGADAAIDKRRRMQQALIVSRALIDQFGAAEEPDLRRLVASARICSAAAMAFLGRWREASRAFDALTKSGDQSVAEAFRAFATAVRSEGGLRGDFGSVSHLSFRAATLGEGDPHITRIAYEDSIRSGAPRTRAGALLARLLAPGKH